MPTITINGARIHYEVRGKGSPIALTPGGRRPLQQISAVGDKLAAHHTVLLWDRRNTGESDTFIGGDSEAATSADDLHGLLQELNLAPAAVGGYSAGARVALTVAIRHPESVRALVLWTLSGGHFGSALMGYEYFVPLMFAVYKHGMEGIIKGNFRSGKFVRSERDVEYLRSMDPNEFLDVMKRWATTFHVRPDYPVFGASESELRAIKVPTLIFRGNDDFHPPEASDAVHRCISDSILVEPPFTGQQFLDLWSRRTVGEPDTDLFPLLADPILAFLAKLDPQKLPD
jgi:pimeloyl-ACP methyl ester carboxylesterase